MLPLPVGEGWGEGSKYEKPEFQFINNITHPLPNLPRFAEEGNLNNKQPERSFGEMAHYSCGFLWRCIRILTREPCKTLQ